MGWGQTAHVSARTGTGGPSVEVTAAAAVCAAQLPAAGIITWVASYGGDDHGGGIVGFGALCMVVLAPPLFLVVGWLHAYALTMPAAGLARRVLRRLGGPEWARHLALVAVLGALWAIPFAVLGRAAYLYAAVLVAVSGVLPVLGVAYVRRRARTPWRALRTRGVWWRAAGASFGLLVVALAGGIAADVMGLVDAYEPPVLSARELTGVWRDGHGAELRLHPLGGAELTRLPAQPDAKDFGREDLTTCDGTGSWLLDRDGRHDFFPGDGPEARDGVLVRVRGGCGTETFWTIGGTQAEPELFVLFGDPDAGDLRILKRHGDG
ncbi:hypothetical protein ACFYP4_15580 [Streptomyces sp. NPDC005551]|uniref:hypothetical protein n=1 Tax=unclassified Streptomyces TaxID=2593676 RepID=UPI0033DEB7C4